MLKTKLPFHSSPTSGAQDLSGGYHPLPQASLGDTHQLSLPKRAEVYSWLSEALLASRVCSPGPRGILPQLICRPAPLWPRSLAFPGLQTYTWQLKKKKPNNVFINYHCAPGPRAAVKQIKFTGQEKSNCHGHSGTSDETEETEPQHKSQTLCYEHVRTAHISGEEAFEGQGDTKELLAIAIHT